MVGHDEIEPAVAVVVAEGGAHPGAGVAVGGDCDAGDQRDFDEPLAALVVKQEVRDRVVGDEQVRPQVVVVVRDRDPEAIAAMPGDPGRCQMSTNAPLPSFR